MKTDLSAALIIPQFRRHQERLFPGGVHRETVKRLQKGYSPGIQKYEIPKPGGFVH